MEPNNFENTVSTSKQESIAKAIDLLLKELESEPKVNVHRPSIDYGRMAMCFIAWLSPIVLVALLLNWYGVGRPYCQWITAGAALISSIVCLKRIVIYLILLYQRFAPERIRTSCVFEPSCSNYMLLAIEKYGVFHGVAKGIRRLLRCHYPNCGEDYP